MARIRTIKPEFWDDEKIGCISRDARLLFIASWNNADDEGLVRWSPEHLKSVAFPYDDDIDASRVRELMAELTASAFVFAYQAGASRQRNGYIVNFRKHQKINRPNPGKLTAPSISNPQVALMYVERDNYECHLCGGPIPRKRMVDGNPYDVRDSRPRLACLNPSLDHVVPRVKGGTDFPSNIRTAHVGCNQGRREKDLDGFSQPSTVAQALAWTQENMPDSLMHSVTDSLSESVTDSLMEVQLPVSGPSKSSTVRGQNSVNGSVSDSQDQHLPEGKGREGRREEGAARNGGTSLVSQREKRTALDDIAGTAHSPAAHRLVEAYAKTCAKRPPGSVLRKLGPAVDELLAADYTDQQIKSALAEWGRKGLGTQHLGAIAHELVNSDRGRHLRSVDDIPDDELTREFLDKELGPDSKSPACAPLDIEEGDPQARKAWYRDAAKQRLGERRGEWRRRRGQQNRTSA